MLRSLTALLTHPPEAWLPGRRLALRALQPVEQFLHTEAASGILLMAAAALALVWANSPWAESYVALWHTPVAIGVGSAVFERDLHFWINEFLMTTFFLVIGLEVKRELVGGALASVRAAALPLCAALGGMVVPAAIYYALNARGPAPEAWGVPMATDIAFAVGVLALLGRRIPASLRVLLLALAIVDDIGAILIIAVFYSAGLSAAGLPPLLLGLALLLSYGWLGLRPGWKYVVPAVLIWAGLYLIGLHPTLAGVIVGLLTPVRPWYGPLGFVKVARPALAEVEGRGSADDMTEDELVAPLGRIAFAAREAVSPVTRLEAGTHGFVSYIVIPLFALANAGVALGGIDVMSPGAAGIAAGVTLGLLVGKPLGVIAVCWLGARLGLCHIPGEYGYRGLVVVGTVAGIGFTMAIFIAELAFPTPESLAVGKAAILAASVVAAVGALGLGRALFPRPAPLPAGG